MAIRWDVTGRCPLRCKYCKIWKMKFRELDTRTIFRIIDELAAVGVKKISFSGGEPLLREDICAIIKQAKDKGISPELNSSGFCFSAKAAGLGALDLLKLSLDGPEEIHDVVREIKGSHKWVMDAARFAQEKRIKFIFCTTLTGYNIAHIEYMLKVAREFGTRVRFQPFKNVRYLKDNTDGFDREIIFSKSQLKNGLDLLKKECRSKNSVIDNSLWSLEHIRSWPKYQHLKCWAGKAFCMINPEGDISPCDRLFYKGKLPNCAERSFQEAFRELPVLPSCPGCGFLGALTLNYLMNFKVDFKLLKKIIN
ncbi:MAG: radical SAM protein [Candidatus Omnitrophica bacterium]|nr:radical SAM protein [Candidatus Omnitrophota bacterium]MBU1924634.1 radical SAM protein [Candidatus Omnitrophota bacterium]